MVKLFCAIVGAAGSAFEVDIDAGASVSALKKAIKAEKMYQFPADELQLFLAKTEGGAWLVSDSEDVKKLKKGEKTVAVEALTSEEKELQGESGLQKVLKGMLKPSTDQIHVLVVVPEQEHAQTGLWLVTGSVGNALNTKGIRCKLYWMATLRIGYYDPTRCIAFWY
ncbi:hypothetical protein PHYSODRAFT_287339, partial [Phytophthora sojae]